MSPVSHQDKVLGDDKLWNFVTSGTLEGPEVLCQEEHVNEGSTADHRICSSGSSVSRPVVSDSLRPPWTGAPQTPPSMEFSRQEYRVESHFPLQGTESASFSSVAQSCLTLQDPMDCSVPGLPVHHQLPEFTQTHLH